MKVYHFSVDFLFSKILYHGEFVCSYKSTDEIIRAGKQALTKRLKEWKQEGSSVVFFEIYRFDEHGDEIKIYEWRMFKNILTNKQNENNFI